MQHSEITESCLQKGLPEVQVVFFVPGLWYAHRHGNAAFADQILYPLTRLELVPRPRLIARLNERLHRTPGVTLISAPAGFGKTTLVSD